MPLLLREAASSLNMRSGAIARAFAGIAAWFLSLLCATSYGGNFRFLFFETARLALCQAGSLAQSGKEACNSVIYTQPWESIAPPFISSPSCSCLPNTCRKDSVSGFSLHHSWAEHPAETRCCAALYTRRSTCGRVRSTPRRSHSCRVYRPPRRALLRPTFCGEC
jgi:hypothetical protein